MAREFGAICSSGHRFRVIDGPIRSAIQLRCDRCGRHHFEQRRELREQNHLGEHLRRNLPAAHREKMERLEAKFDELSRRGEGGGSLLGPLRSVLLDRPRLFLLELRARRLEAFETRWAAANPPPPLSEPDRQCPCGGLFVQGGPIRCPECSTTGWSEDPSVPQMMVD